MATTVTTSAPAYPFDPTGAATTNLVTENQVISPPDWQNFYFIVPTYAPFFANSLKVYSTNADGSQTLLVEGSDYNLGFKFYAASIQCAYPVYGGIVVMNKTFSGNLKIVYQTLGGDWLIDQTQMLAILANQSSNPLTTTWEQVVSIPYQFPPVDHSWDIDDMIGAKDLEAAIQNIADAILSKAASGTTKITGTNVKAISLSGALLKITNPSLIDGTVHFGSPASYTLDRPAKSQDTIIQNVNVLAVGDSTTGINQIETRWNDTIPFFRRYATSGIDPIRAATRQGWFWNIQKNQVQHNRSDTNVCHQLVSSKSTLPAGYTVEMLVSSADQADMAIGIVCAFSDVDGTMREIVAMRDMGGLTTLSPGGGVPGGDIYRLFTIAYNPFQNSAIDLGSTNTGLTWGDGVTDANRSSSTYVPVSQAQSTNGWQTKQYVAIRVTVTLDGTNNMPKLLFETSDYGQSPGAISYVSAAAVTVDLGAQTDANLLALARAILSTGVRWGMNVFQQPNTNWSILNVPDQYERYVQLAYNEDGSDASSVTAYSGSTWNTSDLVDNLIDQPGRIFASSVNNRLYQAAMDGSLHQISLG